MRIPNRTSPSREAWRETLSFFAMVAIIAAVLWAVTVLVAGCGIERVVGIDPVAREGDVDAVAEKIETIHRDQAGLVNAQADVRSEITGIRSDVQNVIDRAVDNWVGIALLTLIGVNGLPELTNLIVAMRKIRPQHPP